MPSSHTAGQPLAPTYKHYRLIRLHGRYYASPVSLADDLLSTGRLRTHPSVLKAADAAALIRHIDSLDSTWQPPAPSSEYRGYRLLQTAEGVYALPPSAGILDLASPADRERCGIIAGTSFADLRASLDRLHQSIPVEFAGWLPIFRHLGNCGHHPQFLHTATPPPCYRFTRSGPSPLPSARTPARSRSFSHLARTFFSAVYLLLGLIMGCLRRFLLYLRPFFSFLAAPAPVRLRSRLRLLASIVRLYFTLRRGGGRFRYVLQFLFSRHFRSQVLLADHDGLVFLTSVPYTYNHSPWLIEIEDPTTLFYPFLHNGLTSEVRVRELAIYPIVRTLLASDSCRAILTHMRSTSRLLPALFQSEAISRKIVYAPLGITPPRTWQFHDDPDPDTIHLLYINSWSQHPGNFHVRGGLDVLEAFATLRVRYPQLRLTIRTSLPPLDDHYHQILESGWVRVIDRFLPAEEMEALHAGSHIFLLPAARVHIVSLLQAMGSGLAVVASDGWGFAEYLTHERNGLLVKGRYGVTSWADEEAGVLRENYEPTYTPDPVVVEGLIEAVSRLVEDADLRRRLGRTARHDVETTYNLANWNAGLKRALDKATAADRPSPNA